MSVIAWWVIPLVATFAAIGYVTWRGRPGPPEDTRDAMEAREAFRRAMERPPVANRHGRGQSKGGPGDDAADRA